MSAAVSTAATADSRAPFLRELDRFRARLVTIDALRGGALAFLPSLFISLAFLAAVDVTSVGTRSVAIAAAAFVSVVSIAAAIVGAMRAPNLTRTAAIADRAIRGTDIVVTAFECRASLDPVSDLIVRDATARLKGVRAAEALPFEVPRALPALSGVCALLLLAAVLVPQRARPFAWPADGAMPSAASDRGPGGSSASRASRAANATQPGTSGQSNAIANNPSRPVRILQADDRRAHSATSQESRGEQPQGSPSAETNSSPSANNQQGAGTERADRTEQRDARSSASHDGRVENAIAAGNHDGASTGGRGRAGGGSSGRGAAAGGFGGDASQLSANVAASAQTARHTLAAVAPDAATYAAAWKRAQTAIARERVPGEYRRLVSDYFKAIRPPQP